MQNQQTVENLEQVWSSIDGLCSELNERQWKMQTDCPGWSVQDLLSHIVGSESNLLGRQPPDHKAPEMDHVKNELGARNEVAVDWRRSWTGEKVLEEFREVTTERKRALRLMKDSDFEVETHNPIGRGTVFDSLQIRIFDAWVHEQDMRRAVGKPGHLQGPVAEHGLGRVSRVMPYVVGKKASAPNGCSVAFQISGPINRRLDVGVEDGRAHMLTEQNPAPTVRLSMDTETFLWLGCGRWSPGEILADGKVEIDGDQELGRTIVEQMNFMV